MVVDLEVGSKLFPKCEQAMEASATCEAVAVWQPNDAAAKLCFEALVLASRQPLGALPPLFYDIAMTVKQRVMCGAVQLLLPERTPQNS